MGLLMAGIEIQMMRIQKLVMVPLILGTLKGLGLVKLMNLEGWPGTLRDDEDNEQMKKVYLPKVYFGIGGNVGGLIWNKTLSK